MNEKMIIDKITSGKENPLTIANLNLNIKIFGCLIPVTNILRDKYYEYIFSISQEITLDDEIFEEFKFKPKLFCYKLYDNIELWHIILFLNEMTSATQFKKNKFRIINPDYLESLYQIITNEYKNISLNKVNPMEINE